MGGVYGAGVYPSFLCSKEEREKVTTPVVEREVEQ
jgi:hypothetical protein